MICRKNKISFSFKKNGFTLIELMTTVGVIGVLSAFAIPAYQDYLIRSQVAEAFSLSSGMKVSLTEYYSVHGKHLSPIENDGVIPAQSGKFVEETKIGYHSKLISKFSSEANNNIEGKVITLKVKHNENGDYNSNLSWDCVSNIAQKYLPISCETLKYDENLNPIEYSSAQRTKFGTVRYRNLLNNIQTSALSAHIGSYNRAVNDYILSSDMGMGQNIILWGMTMRAMKEQLINQGRSVTDFPEIPIFKAMPDDSFDYSSWYNLAHFNNIESPLYQKELEILLN